MKNEIKFDKRNYRKHNDRNKKLIKKSLEECGAGRSILIDNENEIIAGNGIYEQAKKLGIPVKIIETDGSQLIAVKRTDLATQDDKRKQMAFMDNSTSDSSEFDAELIAQDFDKEQLAEYGYDLEYEPIDEYKEPEKLPAGEPATIESIIEQLPEELRNVKLEPEKFEEIVSTFELPRERVIITYPKERMQELADMLGLPSVDKICYTFEEIAGEK